MLTANRDAQGILVNIAGVQIRFPNTPKHEQTVTRLQEALRVKQDDVLNKGVEKGIQIGMQVSGVLNAVFGQPGVAPQEEAPEPETVVINPFNLHEQLTNLKITQVTGNRAVYAVYDTNNTMIGALEFNADAEQPFVLQISAGMGNNPITFGIEVNPDDLETLVSGLSRIGIKSVIAK